MLWKWRGRHWFVLGNQPDLSEGTPWIQRTPAGVSVHRPLLSRRPVSGSERLPKTRRTSGRAPLLPQQHSGTGILHSHPGFWLLHPAFGHRPAGVGLSPDQPGKTIQFCHSGAPCSAAGRKPQMLAEPSAAVCRRDFGTDSGGTGVDRGEWFFPSAQIQMYGDTSGKTLRIFWCIGGNGQADSSLPESLYRLRRFHGTNQDQGDHLYPGCPGASAHTSAPASASAALHSFGVLSLCENPGISTRRPPPSGTHKKSKPDSSGITACKIFKKQPVCPLTGMWDAETRYPRRQCIRKRAGL